METSAPHNRVGIFVLLASYLAALFLLPQLLADSKVWGLALIPLVALSIVHWGYIHEAIHKLLDPDAVANERLARALGVTMGASFHVLRFGHLMHHKLNRDWHSERVARRTPASMAYYYANLLFGLYLGEVMTSILLAVLPHRVFMRVARASFLKGYDEVAMAGERFFYQRKHIVHVRHDMLASLALHAAAFWLYGADGWMLAGFMVARAAAISFLDNIYHYATPDDNSKAGKELALPALASRLLLHSNYHETHHLNPDVPWRKLPALHAAQQRGFDGKWLQHARLQWAGPVV